MATGFFLGQHMNPHFDGRDPQNGVLGQALEAVVCCPYVNIYLHIPTYNSMVIYPSIL